MARPVVAAVTERAFAELPDLYRDADVGLDWPLLRYVSILGDGVFAEVDELLDAVGYVPEDEGAGPRTSALVDPTTADPAWLPWLAQAVGVRLDRTASVAEQRLQIDARRGQLAGTRDSIVAAAQTALLGTRHCTVVPHYGGDPWMLGIQTLTTETPDDQAVIDAVLAAGVKPVGYGLTVTHYVSSWATQEAAYPTWTARESAAQWDVIEAVGG